MSITASTLTHRTLGNGILSRLFAVLHSTMDSWHEHSRYRTTLRELNTLSERELNDLGIARADIEGIAREAAK